MRIFFNTSHLLFKPLALGSFLVFMISATFQSSAQEVVLLHDNWQFQQQGMSRWLPATIPGTVHTDLLANQRIQDPFYRTNEQDLQWIENEDWVYKTDFQVEASVLGYEHIHLNFDGLDTYAEIFLNGVHVLTAENMFRAWQCDVKALLKDNNTLEVRFTSPMKRNLPVYDSLEYQIPVSNNDFHPKKVSIFSRKAGYHYGWDWGPRFVTAGIWKPVYLQAWNGIKIVDPYLYQSKVTRERAEGELRLQVRADQDEVVTVELLDQADQRQILRERIRLKKGVNELSLPFELEAPKLWWPNGIGEPFMYKFSVNVSDKSAIIKTGFRSIELVQESGERGKSFYFRVNGHPVFSKGANYIPQDSFLPRVSDDQYRHVLTSAQQAHMNMIRVWGGGIYEDDIFYDLCDSLGLMVWQDFMFACAMYPGFPGFLQNVRLEAEDNLKRLRNHPSIALWCGNNESIMMWKKWKKNEIKDRWDGDKIKPLWSNPDDSLEITHAYENIFHNILPAAVHKYAPNVPYWSSSPQPYNYSFDMDWSGISGDYHYWGVWWGKEPFENYKGQVKRFMSEYGFQSFPPMATITEFAVPEDYEIFSDVMRSHQKSSIGNGTITHYMEDLYGIPKDFERFIYVNLVQQGEGVKVGMEAHRRSKPYCMGSLYWQLQDCWPVASWSGMDYYGRWKALHYQARDAFKPMIVSATSDGKTTAIYVVSDLLEDQETILNLRIMDLSGEVSWQKEVPVKVTQNSSRSYLSFENQQRISDPTTQVVVAEIFEAGRKAMIDQTVFYYEKPKNMAFEDPGLKYKLKKEGGGRYSIQLVSKQLVKALELSIAGQDIVFSDNYFDLLPGEEKMVTFLPGKPVDKKDILVQFYNIRSK